MRLSKIILLIVLISNNVYAKNNFFSEGLAFFEKKNFEKAQFKFEQDIVFNPKSEKSYLYLSKIYNKQDKKDLEEKNLNTVLLLNPLNEEAIYNLAKLKLKVSDFEESRKLTEKLLKLCVDYCLKSKDLKEEIEKSIKN